MPKLLQQCIDDAFEVDNDLANSTYRKARRYKPVPVLNTERLKELIIGYLASDFQAELASISDLKQLSDFEKKLLDYAHKEAQLDISSQLKLINEKKQALAKATVREEQLNQLPRVETQPASDISLSQAALHLSSEKHIDKEQAASRPASDLSTSSRPVYLLRDKYCKTHPDLINLLQKTLPQCTVTEVSNDPDADPSDIIAGLDLTYPPVLIFGPMTYKRRLDELKLRREFGLIAFNVAYLSFESLEFFETTRIKQLNQQSNIQSLFLDQNKPCFNEEQITLLQSLCITERPKFTQQAPVTLDDALALLNLYKKYLKKKALLNEKLAKLTSEMINEIKSLKEQNIYAERIMAIYHLIEQITRPHKTKEDIRKADQAIRTFAKEVAYSPTSVVARSLGVIALTALGILAAVAAVMGIGMAVGIWLGPMAAVSGFVALLSGSAAQMGLGVGISFGVATTGLATAMIAKSCLFHNPQQNIAQHAREMLEIGSPTFKP